VVVAGRPVALGGLRRRTLLAVLLVHRGEVVSLDRLIDEAWRGQPPARARDLTRFESFLSLGRDALLRDDARSAADLLSAALGLWAGSALDGLDDVAS